MLETSLGAIARLRDFETHTEVEEKAGETAIPPKNWPSRGLIEIEDLTASYKFVLLTTGVPRIFQKVSNPLQFFD